jgi:teichuronic acid biosynthesis glycosyltransferase TuaG
MTQTVDNWEVIIGINGHPENSLVYNIANKYELPNKIYVVDLFFLEGKAQALNYMIELSKYDHIAILDVDDIWLPSKLEYQIPFLTLYDVVGTRCVYFGDMEGNVPSIPTGDLDNIDFLSTNPIINSSAIIRKELCQWSDDYGLDDYQLWLTLRKQNKKFYNCPEILVQHRLHKNSAFNASGKQELERLRLDFS